MICAGIGKTDASWSRGGIHAKRVLTKFPEGIRPGGAELTDRLVELCDFRSGSWITDIGCGTGFTLNHIRKKYGCNVAGADRSFAILDAGKKCSPGLMLINSDGRHLPFRDRSMDGVIAECTLSVMDDTPAVLDEISRILSDNGKLAISDIYIRRPEKAHLLKDAFGGGILSGVFTIDGLRAMLADSGFGTVLWEDQSKYWKEFIAGIIMNGGEQCGVGNCGRDSEIFSEDFIEIASEVKLGYFTMVAGKRE
jgi:arsenite methyltransferase